MNLKISKVEIIHFGNKFSKKISILFLQKMSFQWLLFVTKNIKNLYNFKFFFFENLKIKCNLLRASLPFFRNPFAL